jgi:spermidine synthase
MGTTGRRPGIRRYSHTVFETESLLSGRIRVIEDQVERRLVVAGDTLSVYPLDGDWSRVHQEYWWHALSSVTFPRRPSVLLVGLGGGTQIHLLRRLARPRQISAIERDPVIVRVARDWFGLARVGGIEFLCDEADVVVPSLAAAERRFDFIMEDAAYAESPERALPLARALAERVAPGGSLVLNRHYRSDATALTREMRPRFEQVLVRRVRREGENALVICARPLFPASPSAEETTTTGKERHHA